jgi:hypothetical protein
MKNSCIVTMTVIAVFITGCCIKGSGDLETETRNVDDFENIDIDISGDIIISQGDTFRVTVKTDDNLIDDITTEVRNNTLYIDRDHDGRCINFTSLVVRIRLPELRSIKIDGSSEVEIKDGFETETMKLTVDGSGDIVAREPLSAEVFTVGIDGSGDVNLKLEVAELNTIIDGSGDVTYTGYATDHYINIDGSGDVKAYDLETEYTDIRIDGSGSCKVTVEEALDVSINGSGDVYFKWNPSVSKRIEGSGSVKNAN